MDPLKVSIVAAWDHGVEDYDELAAHGRLTPAEAVVWKAVLARELPPPPATVLEVGAGTGVISLLIAELGYRLTAIDLSRGMLQQARRKAGERGLAITFEIADAEVLPFRDAAFEAVVGRHILWTLPSPERALAEWYRVLRPSGRLVLIDSVASPPTMVSRIQRVTGQVLRRLQRPRLGGHRYPPEVRAALPLAGNADPARYNALIRAAGFEMVAVERLDQLNALQRKVTPLVERWHSQERPYLFSARRS